MTESLINSGLVLTLYGMGTVFIFLVLLIFATRAMSWVALKIDSPQPHIRAPAEKPINSEVNVDDSQLVAIISAAVKHYRQTNTRK